MRDGDTGLCVSLTYLFESEGHIREDGDGFTELVLKSHD